MRPNLYAADSTYHQQRRWTHPHTLRCLQTAIDALGTPESLLDVGCAEGVLVTWANGAGILAMGIDLAVPVGHPSLVCADLRQPIDMGRRFEWVLCWEVAEHLPEASAITLVETLARHVQPTGRVLFTAAGPGQRGPGHVHCAKPEVWHEFFATQGLARANGLSADLQQRWLRCAPRTPWYGRNISVYWRQA